MPQESEKNEQVMESPQEETVDVATPNRDAYAQMWSEDNGDVDFEDKESRYGRAIEDRNELRERRKNDEFLGSLFDNHNWLAMMYAELKENPDISPFEWLEGFCQKHGVSLQEVLDDEEARKRLTEKMNEYQKKKAENEKADEEKENNLQSSAEALKQLQAEKNLSDEDCLAMWGDFWKMIDDAENGNVSVDTWKAFEKSRNYDTDIQSARDEASMQARNEKIQNKVRKASQQEGLPPTLSQGSGAPAQRKEKKESFLSGLNG